MTTDNDPSINQNQRKIVTFRTELGTFEFWTWSGSSFRDIYSRIGGTADQDSVNFFYGNLHSSGAAGRGKCQIIRSSCVWKCQAALKQKGQKERIRPMFLFSPSQRSIVGSVVECSPATRAARVRFPDDANHLFLLPTYLNYLSTRKIIRL